MRGGGRGEVRDLPEPSVGDCSKTDGRREEKVRLSCVPRHGLSRSLELSDLLL